MADEAHDQLAIPMEDGHTLYLRRTHRRHVVQLGLSGQGATEPTVMVRLEVEDQHAIVRFLRHTFLKRGRS